MAYNFSYTVFFNLPGTLLIYKNKKNFPTHFFKLCVWRWLRVLLYSSPAKAWRTATPVICAVASNTCCPMETLYFSRFNPNEETRTCTLILADGQVTANNHEIAGVKGLSISSQNNISFGVLSIREAASDKVIGMDHPKMKKLMSSLKKGDPMPGLRLSENPVINRTTGEPTGLYWVEKAPSK